MLLIRVFLCTKRLQRRREHNKIYTDNILLMILFYLFSVYFFFRDSTRLGRSAAVLSVRWHCIELLFVLYTHGKIQCHSYFATILKDFRTFRNKNYVILHVQIDCEYILNLLTRPIILISNNKKEIVHYAG